MTRAQKSLGVVDINYKNQSNTQYYFFLPLPPNQLQTPSSKAKRYNQTSGICLTKSTNRNDATSMWRIATSRPAFVT